MIVSRSYFTPPPPPQLSRAGYHPGDPRWAAAARSDAGEAPRALTPAACLARSADRAGLWLSPVRAQRTTATSNSANTPTISGPAWHSRRPHQRHCGTGIWRDRDIVAGWRYLRHPARLFRPVAKPAAHSRAESRGFRPAKVAPGERQTLRWREPDSNHRSLPRGSRLDHAIIVANGRGRALEDLFAIIEHRAQ